MKKLFLIFVAIATLSCTQTKNENQNANKDFPSRAVAIMNPTVANIKTFFFLIENQILPINTDSIGVLGVYHMKQNYNFGQSAKYIEEQNLPMKLIECVYDISPQNLYEENDCSKDFKEIFEHTDGIFFFGGPDIPGECFGQKAHLTASTNDAYRHFFELSFLFHLLGGSQNESVTPLLETKPEYVVVGFCLGMQTMNCAAGGDMIQDIPMQIYNIDNADDMLAAPEKAHKNYNAYFDYDDKFSSYIFHKIKTTGNNIVSDISNNGEPYVLSVHHQAVGKIGKNIEVAATSEDGKIVEVIVHSKYKNVIATQFHPEHTSLYRKDAKIKLSKNHSDSQNYLSMYGGEKGETFHRNFWLKIGEWLKK